MRAIDHYIVRLDKTHEDSLQHGSLKLWLPAFTDIISDENSDTPLYNPNKFKRLFGIVLFAPFKLSDAKESPVYTGLPQPRYPVTGDEIAACAAQGSNYITKDDYYPSNAKMVWASVKDKYKTEAKEGDIVYFFWDSADESTLIDELTYRIHIRDIIAFTNSEGTFCHSGHVLCERNEESNVTDAGVFTSSVAKVKPLSATVRMVGTNSKLAPGDEIRFIPNADISTKVEGVEMAAIRESDVLCKVEKV